MATAKEIKDYLKENDYTEADMNRFWNECIEVNSKVRLLNNAGKTWKDLPINQIEKLPKLKKKTLKKLKKAQKAEKKAKEQEPKEERVTEQEIPKEMNTPEAITNTESQKEDYDEEDEFDAFEKEMVAKIDAGEALTRSELDALIEYELEHETGDNDRWTRSVASIIELCGRHFSLTWQEGLTEYQENSFFNQPYEVWEHTYEKTITVTEWTTEKTGEKQADSIKDIEEQIAAVNLAMKSAPVSPYYTLGSDGYSKKISAASLDIFKLSQDRAEAAFDLNIHIGIVVADAQHPTYYDFVPIKNKEQLAAYYNDEEHNDNNLYVSFDPAYYWIAPKFFMEEVVYDAIDEKIAAQRDMPQEEEEEEEEMSL